MSYLHAETNDRCDDCTSNVESLALSLPFIVGGGDGTGGGCDVGEPSAAQPLALAAAAARRDATSVSQSLADVLPQTGEKKLSTRYYVLNRRAAPARRRRVVRWSRKVHGCALALI